MALPRRVVRGAFYLITRRTSQRIFRLRPCGVTNRILEYSLAYAATKSGVVVLAYIAMSNHHHIVVYDPDGRLPVFLHLLHMLSAKALNAAQGERENLWAAEPASAVVLPSAADVLEKIGYIAANPVAAALVRCPSEWPGVVHWRPGTRVTASRPEHYFSDAMPAEVVLTLGTPGKLECSEAEWATRVERAVAESVRRARADVGSSGIAFLGRDRVLKSSFLTKAKTYEEKRGINPRLAARSPETRAACVSSHRRFQTAYREAMKSWRAGARDTCFPAGTWWMRVFHGAKVEPAPP